MQRKYTQDYVPIELLRTIVAIADLGSFTKAGHVLGLTQSAISAQMKRLQQLAGTDVFMKNGGGLGLTDRGRAIDRYARRILDLNEQIMLLSGPVSTSRPVRIGLPISFAASMLVDAFEACSAAAGGQEIQLQCARSEELLKNLESGYLDIAMAMTARPMVDLISEWEEALAWVRSPDLLVSPGAPIPYISWPESATDEIALGMLERSGMRYAVAFAGADFNGRHAAAQAGLGYLVMPERAVAGRVIVAREKYLPALQPLRGGICVRADFNSEAMGPLLRAFEKVVHPPEKPAVNGAANGAVARPPVRSLAAAEVAVRSRPGLV